MNTAKMDQIKNSSLVTRAMNIMKKENMMPNEENLKKAIRQAHTEETALINKMKTPAGINYFFNQFCEKHNVK